MRIRTIKPEFWASLSVTQLSPSARLTFVGLWNYADDKGRAVCDARLIKAALWPLDDRMTAAKVLEHIEQIAELGLITRYDVHERSYYAVNGWEEHQTISHPRPSTLPEPPGTSPGAFPQTAGGFPEASGLEGKGKEQGKEGKGREGSELALRAFDEFWMAYPRRTGKGAARTAFAKARDKASPADIIAAASRFAADPNREAEFTPHPTTWLNQERWADDPLPPRGTKGKNVSNILAMAERAEGA